MNSSFLYAIFFTGFGLLDLLTGNGFSLRVDFGIALIFLGIGLSRKNKNEGKT